MYMYTCVHMYMNVYLHVHAYKLHVYYYRYYFFKHFLLGSTRQDSKYTKIIKFFIESEEDLGRKINRYSNAPRLSPC